MHIVKADAKQLPLILPIYEQARRFMARNGNAGQWTNGYPSAELLRGDIARGHLYICLDGADIAAAFCFRTGNDPTYAHIDGAWLNSLPYGVIHRLAAVRPGKGAASFCVQWCLAQYPNLRIDTHEKNIPMQKVLLKNGFVYCGIIRTDDGTPRRAYQFSLPQSLIPSSGMAAAHFTLFAPKDYPSLLPLLLEADPCESVVKNYFTHSLVWGYQRGQEPLAEACIQPLAPGLAELKNLAVRTDLRGQGVGRALCLSVFSACQGRGFVQLIVGTADVPGHPGPFYQKLGFSFERKEKDFFLRHYPHPIYDNGRLCRDMLFFRLELRDNI